MYQVVNVVVKGGGGWLSDLVLMKDRERNVLKKHGLERFRFKD